MSGTAIAQMIPVAISPVLTRLFSPADLGALALYLSLVAIAVVVATGRYELAILLPSRDHEAFCLLVIAIGLAFVFCVLGFIGILIFKETLLSSFPAHSNLGYSFYVIPLGVLLTGMYQSLSCWANRKKQYSQLARSRIVQAGTMCGTQVLTGVARVGSGGLIAGHVLGQVIANVFLLRSTWKDDLVYLKQSTFDRALIVARRHQSFPVFMVPGHLANVASSQMPVLLLSLLYGPAVAGFYSLAERVLVLPSSIIGSAIGEVYRQQAAVSYDGVGNCRDLYLRTARKLALFALLPCVIAAAIGPWIFSVVFGSFWREAGEIAAVLATMVFFQMVSSPLSQTVLLAHMYRLDMLWQIARLALSAGSIYFGYILSSSYYLAIVLYAASFSVLHLLHSLMQYKAACGDASIARGNL